MRIKSMLDKIKIGIKQARALLPHVKDPQSKNYLETEIENWERLLQLSTGSEEDFPPEVANIITICLETIQQIYNKHALS